MVLLRESDMETQDWTPGGRAHERGCEQDESRTGCSPELRMCVRNREAPGTGDRRLSMVSGLVQHM